MAGWSSGLRGRASRIILMCVALAALPVLGDSATVTMKLGPYVFDVPEANSMEGRAPFWLKAIPGLDSGQRSASIVFRADEMRRAIPGFTDSVDLFATLSVLNDVEIARQRDPSFYRDMWYLTGAFENARIEPLGETGMFRIFRKREKTFWEIISARPNPFQAIPAMKQEFWIASCSTGAPGRPASCNSSYFFHKDLLVEFHFSEADIGRIDAIREYIRASVLSWEQPKGGAHKERQS